MIKSVELHNFLSHPNSIAYFHENNNIFIGNSDSGKSAFLKGLKWCRWNRPLGDDFYSWPEVRDDKDKSMWVKVTTDDHTITRKKGKDEEYILDGVSFKAFGTNVPQEIIDAFNLSEINWQNQLDSHFLLSSTAGDVASFFNKVANLEKIDTGTQKVNSAIRELTADIKYKEAQEEKLNIDLSTYSHISIFESEVQELEELDKELVNLTSDKDRLNNTTANLRLLNIKIEQHQKTLELEKPLNIVLNLIEERAKKDIEEVKLDRLVNHIQRIQVEIDEQKELLKSEKLVTELLQLYSDKKMAEDRRGKLSVVVSSLKGIQDSLNEYVPLIALKVPLDSLLLLIEQRDKAEESKLGLLRIVSSYRTIQTRITNGNVWIKTQEGLFEKEMGQTCILCGSKLNHNHGKN
jgi:exonuclease SbcC